MKKLYSTTLAGALCISSIYSFTPNVNIDKHHTRTTPFKSNNILIGGTTTATTSISKGIKTEFGRQDTSLTALPVPIDHVVDLYNQLLLSNPLETKLATGGILAMAGDAIAQSRDVGGYDTKRAGAFVCFDMLYRALQIAIFPEIVHTCDGHYLGTLLPNMDFSVLAIMEQTMANQFFVIPFIYYPVFFSLTGYVQGLSQEATIERVKTTIGPLLKRNWTFWIPVQYFQFGYVDEPLQIPFLCVVGLAWTFILSVAVGSVSTYDEDEIEYDIDDMVYSNMDKIVATSHSSIESHGVYNHNNADQLVTSGKDDKVKLPAQEVSQKTV